MSIDPSFTCSLFSLPRFAVPVMVVVLNQPFGMSRIEYFDVPPDCV